MGKWKTFKKWAGKAAETAADISSAGLYSPIKEKLTGQESSSLIDDARDYVWDNTVGKLVKRPDAPKINVPDGTGDVVPDSADTIALQQLRDKYNAGFDKAGGPAPTLDARQSDEVRARQLGQLDRLEGVATGVTPSIADAQRRTAQFDATQNILGLAAGAQGADSGGARRMAGRQISDAGRKVGMDAALIKANEVSQANAQIGGLLGQARGADLQGASTNLAAGLQHRGQTIQEQGQLGQLGLDAQKVATVNRSTDNQIKLLRDQLTFAYEQLRVNADAASQAAWGARIDSIIGALGALGVAAI